MARMDCSSLALKAEGLLSWSKAGVMSCAARPLFQALLLVMQPSKSSRTLRVAPVVGRRRSSDLREASRQTEAAA